jgi:aspartyl-tRNA(Asn)/glutamyl-tRNA(Gln) amidotransferase subunit A
MTRFETETIAAAAERLRAGTLTARDLVERCLAAIDTYGAATNAFTRVHADQARSAAGDADRQLRAGSDLGPLHGIPISLKDLIDEAGIPNTAGSKSLDDRIPEADAPLVAALRRSGAIVLGRTNLHEFALGTTSDESGFGPVRNPHDLSRSPGGSSGGSGAAVAAGMGLASIGTDTGGSIRIPAAACGVVGLKPSIGDVSTDGIVPLSTTLDHAGPLALSVQDAAWIWQAIAGRPFATVTARPMDSLVLLRPRGYFDAPVEPAVQDVFEAALDRLAASGASIVDVDVAEAPALGQAYADLALPEAARWHGSRLDERADRYSPTVHARLLYGRTITAVAYIEAQALRERITATCEGLLARHNADAFVLPTLPVTAPPVGTTEIELDGEKKPVRGVMLKHTQPFNFTGQPAISLPIAAPGLPIGLQLAGRRAATAALLEVALAVEHVLNDSHLSS